MNLEYFLDSRKSILEGVSMILFNVKQVSCCLCILWWLVVAPADGAAPFTAALPLESAKAYADGERKDRCPIGLFPAVYFVRAYML